MESESQILLYRLPNGEAQVEAIMKDETLWMTQKAMAQLFGVDKSGISRHLNNIFKTGELQQDTTVAKFATVVNRGIRGEVEEKVDYYNLDAVIAVGYRVNSKQATLFRQWATQVLNEYIRKGFALDDERLKELGGGGYWKELLNRIRDIRSSEKVMYRQVLDLYATAVDYDPRSDTSILFFKIVQNKLHYATHGHTAAEIIFDRANAEHPFMGLTTFKGGWPTLADAKVAKNYLTEEELKVLNSLVSGYFDLAESRAARHIPMYMKDYVKHLDSILSANGDLLLIGGGSVTHEEAMEKATAEYRRWQQNTLSPVEQAYLDTIKMLSNKGKKGG